MTDFCGGGDIDLPKLLYMYPSKPCKHLVMITTVKYCIPPLSCYEAKQDRDRNRTLNKQHSEITSPKHMVRAH